MSLDSFVTYVLDPCTPGARASHTRSLDEAQRNPGISGSVEKPRITFHFIQATQLYGNRRVNVKFAEAFGFW
jgi:hypothetical protein